MRVLRRHSDFVRFVAVLLVTTFLSACMKWQTQSLQPERFQSSDSTQVLRLRLSSGDTVILHAPVISHDSLVGMRTPPGMSSDSLERVSIPLAAIARAERQHDLAGAMLLASVLGFALSAALVAAMCHGFLCSGKQ